MRGEAALANQTLGFNPSERADEESPVVFEFKF